MSQDATTHRRPEWFQVKYNLAAQKAHLSLVRESEDIVADPSAGATDPSEDLADAIEHASTLLLETATLLEASPDPPIFAEAPKLRPFLAETLEPATAVLLAGTLHRRAAYGRGWSWGLPRIDARGDLIRVLEREAPPSPDALIVYVMRAKEISYRVRYNLACYFAEKSPGPRHPDIDEAWRQLRFALAKAPRIEAVALANWASEDPSLQHLAIARRESLRRLLALYRLPPVRRAEAEAQPENGRREDEGTVSV